MSKQNVFLLWGKDAEMVRIRQVLEKTGQLFIDKELPWGAQVTDYATEIANLLAAWKQPVAIELAGAGEGDFVDVLSIDHHGERSHEQASLLQLLIEMLGISPDSYDLLIAANDAGYIPGIRKQSHLLGIHDPIAQQALITSIRTKDRQAQWITLEQELQAEEAIKYKEELLDGQLTIVHLLHNKSTTVTDRLFWTYQNLLVLSADGEANFYGDGALCKQLAERYPGSWSGWSWLGEQGGDAYRGGKVEQEELKQHLIYEIALLSHRK